MHKFSFYQLKDIAEDCGINPYNKSKPDLYREIMSHFCEEEKDLPKTDTYREVKEIGRGGNDSVVYLAKKDGKEFAMKKFNSNVCTKEIKKEVGYQKKASGISPEIVDVDYEKKSIVMEKMDSHVVDYLTKNKGKFPIKYQKRLIEIFTALDEKGVYQADPNILNYMFKGDRIYMIDFGMCKPINKYLIKKLGTDKPNMKYTLLSFICKLKEGNCSPRSYSHLLKYVS